MARTILGWRDSHISGNEYARRTPDAVAAAIRRRARSAAAADGTAPALGEGRAPYAVYAASSR